MFKKGFLLIAFSILILSGCSIPSISNINSTISKYLPVEESDPNIKRLEIDNSKDTPNSQLSAEERVNQTVDMTVEDGVDVSMNEFKYVETYVKPKGKRAEILNEKGSLFIVGQMENTGTETIKDIRQEIHIADEKGQVLYKETVRDELLEPNEVWSYRIPLKTKEYPTAKQVEAYDLSFFSVKMNDVLTIANKEYLFTATPKEASSQ